MQIQGNTYASRISFIKISCRLMRTDQRLFIKGRLYG